MDERAMSTLANLLIHRIAPRNRTDAIRKDMTDEERSAIPNMLLLTDNLKTHTGSSAVLEQLQGNKIFMFTTLPHCTDILQVEDVHYFQFFNVCNLAMLSPIRNVCNNLAS